jgi:hypothetical protein
MYPKRLESHLRYRKSINPAYAKMSLQAVWIDGLRIMFTAENGREPNHKELCALRSASFRGIGYSSDLVSTVTSDGKKRSVTIHGVPFDFTQLSRTYPVGKNINSLEAVNTEQVENWFNHVLWVKHGPGNQFVIGGIGFRTAMNAIRTFRLDVAEVISVWRDVTTTRDFFDEIDHKIEVAICNVLRAKGYELEQVCILGATFDTLGDALRAWGFNPNHAIQWAFDKGTMPHQWLSQKADELWSTRLSYYSGQITWNDKLYNSVSEALDATGVSKYDVYKYYSTGEYTITDAFYQAASQRDTQIAAE